MVLVDVDSFLEGDSFSDKTDESLERMFEELNETIRKPSKTRTKVPKSHAQIAATYHGKSATAGTEELKTSVLSPKKKRSSASSSSSSKSKKGKSSPLRSSSSHAVGSMLSLPTIDESINNSDTESIERITQTPSVGKERTPSAVVEPSLLSDIVWDAKYANPREVVDAKKGNDHRISSILNGSCDDRKESLTQSTRKGVRFSSVQVIEVEPSVQYQKNKSRPELEDPAVVPSSRRKISRRSTSSEKSSRSSKEALIPELQQLAHEDAAAAPSRLDLHVVSSPSPGSENRSSDTDTSSSEEGSTDRPTTTTTKNSCFKSSPGKYRQYFTYLLAILLLACSATLLTVALKVLPADHGTTNSTATNSGVSTATPTTAPLRLTTVAPTMAPVADYNDTRVRDPVVFLNCGGPSVQIKNRIWESDRLHSYFILGDSRTKGRMTDPLCQDFVLSVNLTSDDLNVVRDGDFSALFCSERFFPAATGGGYEIPVPTPGDYRIEFYFIEGFHNMTRQRVFNISVEGDVIRDDFDILMRAGGANLPTKLITTKQVDDGVLSISLKSSIGNPTINALAVYQLLDEQ